MEIRVWYLFPLACLCLAQQGRAFHTGGWLCDSPNRDSVHVQRHFYVMPARIAPPCSRNTGAADSTCRSLSSGLD